MKDIELMIEIFMCFKGARIMGDAVHGYTFEALGIKYRTKPGWHFSGCLEDAMKHFAKNAHGQREEHEAA